jgi:type I restriction enzyme, R subunit
LFGPGRNKEFFYLFDYCQNLEYFSQNIPATEGSAADSLGKRLFNARLELIAALDGRSQDALVKVLKESMETYGDPKTNEEVRRCVAELLQREVAAMNVDNFVVRPYRRLVEKYAKPEAWVALASEALAELSHKIAGLPSQLDHFGYELGVTYYNLVSDQYTGLYRRGLRGTTMITRRQFLKASGLAGLPDLRGNGGAL